MVAHEGHGSESMESMSGMSGMSGSGEASGGHMGMASSFIAATNTPLYSEAWTPSSAGAYAGTCIFLIILAIVLRAIFTAKAFLDARALHSALKRRYVVVADQQSPSDKAFNDASSMTGILTTNGLQENVRMIQAPVKATQPFRFSVDLPRAALMTVATGVGYLL
jgi:copper transporter 1